MTFSLSKKWNAAHLSVHKSHVPALLFMMLCFQRNSLRHLKTGNSRFWIIWQSKKHLQFGMLPFNQFCNGQGIQSEIVCIVKQQHLLSFFLNNIQTLQKFPTLISKFLWDFIYAFWWNIKNNGKCKKKTDEQFWKNWIELNEKCASSAWQVFCA